MRTERVLERQRELREEWEKGQKLILEQQHAVQETQAILLRIQGALTVLEGLIEEHNRENGMDVAKVEDAA